MDNEKNMIADSMHKSNSSGSLEDEHVSRPAGGSQGPDPEPRNGFDPGPKRPPPKTKSHATDDQSPGTLEWKDVLPYEFICPGCFERESVGHKCPKWMKMEQKRNVDQGSEERAQMNVEPKPDLDPEPSPKATAQIKVGSEPSAKPQGQSQARMEADKKVDSNSKFPPQGQDQVTGQRLSIVSAAECQCCHGVRW